MRTKRGSAAPGPLRAHPGTAALWAALLLPLVLVAGCATTPAPAAHAGAKAAVRIATLKGPTGVGMVHLMKAQQDGTAANDYTFIVSEAPEDVAAKVASGDVDLAAVPTNLAAALYAKTSKAVQLLAVNTVGGMYIVSADPGVHSLADLAGRTVVASGQGSNPEYVLRFLLQTAGLDPDTDLTLDFKGTHDEVATLLASGKTDVALLPEPFVTTVTLKQPVLAVAVDLSAEWAKAVTDGSRMMTGGVIVRRAFATAHPEAVARFLTEYEASITAATSDVATTATLCEEFGIIGSAAVARQAIPRLNLTFLSGPELATGIEGYYRVLHAANPASVGGAIPDSGFYDAAR